MVSQLISFRKSHVITRHQHVTIRRLTHLSEYHFSEYHGPSSHLAADRKKAAQKKANIKAEEKKQRDAAKRCKIEKRFQDKWLAVSGKFLSFFNNLSILTSHLPDR